MTKIKGENKPTEHKEQAALFQWAELNKNRFPELGLMFAIPNGGKRHIGTAKKLKAEGVKAGVPDIFLPFPVGLSHGLFIEMKSKNGIISKSQSDFIVSLKFKSYVVEVCYGFEEAKKAILDYLRIKS